MQRILLTTLLAFCGCTDGSALLLVNVRTSLVPGVDFERVTTFIHPSGSDEVVAHVDQPADPLRDYVSGDRVAEIELGAGAYDVVVELSCGGEVTASGTGMADVVETSAVTIDVDGVGGCRRDGGPADASLDGGVDGAATDADVLDVSVDAAPDETACDDILAGAIFCDSFEASDFSLWDSVREMDGRVMRTTDPVWRGSGALSAASLAASGVANLFGARLADVTSGDLWLRAYVYVPSGTAFDDVKVLTLHEGSAPYAGVAFGLTTGDRPYVMATTGSVSAVATDLRFDRDRWVCVVLHVDVDDAAGAMALQIDGEPAVERTGIDTLPDTGYQDVVVGIGFTSTAQLPIGLFVDEVALDDALIPCDGP